MTHQYQSRSPSKSLLRKLFQCHGVLALRVADLADAQRRAVLDLVSPPLATAASTAWWTRGCGGNVSMILRIAGRRSPHRTSFSLTGNRTLTGISLANENLARRPAKFITDPNMARLVRCVLPTIRMACSTAGGHAASPLNHFWQGSRCATRCSQRALQQHLSVVGGNHLHR